jgi:hypothetical protein
VLINEQQFAVFDAEAKRAFRSSMRAFVREHHTRYIDDLSEDEVNSFVEDAIASGAEFGCETDRDYMLFSTPCAIYGARSMRDPLFERIYFAPLDWSGARIRRSIDSMMDSLTRLLDSEFADASGAQVLQGLANGLYREGTARALRLTGENQLLPFFERFFPARIRRLSEGELAAHLSKSRESARRIGLNTPEGILVYQQVAFFIGCEFGGDGLYPWAVKALSKDVPEEARLRRLEAAVKVITDRAAEAR